MIKTSDGTILPDMFYLKAEHKDEFLKTVKARTDWAGTNKGEKYPKFLNIGKGRKCDYSGDILQPDDDVYCVYVEAV